MWYLQHETISKIQMVHEVPNERETQPPTIYTINPQTNQLGGDALAIPTREGLKIL